MRKSMLTGVSASALMLSVTAVSAADLDPMVPAVRDSGWYISLFAGLNVLEDFENDYVYTGTPWDTYLETHEGFAVGGAVGRRVWGNFRADVEVTYSKNEADDFVFLGYAPSDATGEVESLTVLGNLWYDFDTGTMFTPYIGGGAGIGAVWGDYDYSPSFGGGQIVDGTDVGFAFQAGAGVNVALSQSFDLTLGYRFRGILDVSLDSTYPGSSNKNGDYFAHTVFGGITWKFPGLFH